jgi:GNAT superfamily N-acetyltransferase
MEKIITRPATLEDVDAILADVQLGFDSYAEFAPLGWRPPDVFAERDRTADLLGDSATWGLVAYAGERTAGHVAFFPAREQPTGERGDWSRRPLIPGLAHLWQLFIRAPWWGRGVAPMLHDASIAEMQVRGYRSARLYTPSLHARARRFYERRGWSAGAEAWNQDLALMLTEYVRELD